MSTKIGTLPKYVMVAGGPTLLISMDAGHETIPRGTYMPIMLPDGHVKLEGVSAAVYRKMFTVHRDVWPVAVQDFRIMEA